MPLWVPKPQDHKERMFTQRFWQKQYFSLCPTQDSANFPHRVWPGLSMLPQTPSSVGKMLGLAGFYLFLVWWSFLAAFPPWPSARPTRNTARTRSPASWCRSFYAPAPDTFRLFQTKAYFMPHSLALEVLFFKSRNCKATLLAWSQKEGVGYACGLLSFLFFFSFTVGMWCHGPAPNTVPGTCLWFCWALMMRSSLPVNFGAKGRDKKENLINHPQNLFPKPISIPASPASLRSLATPSGQFKIITFF